MQVGHDDEADRLRVDARERAAATGGRRPGSSVGRAKLATRRPRFSAGFELTEGCSPVSTRNGPAEGWWIRKAGTGSPSHFERGVPIPSMRGTASRPLALEEAARSLHPPAEQRLDGDGRPLAPPRERRCEPPRLRSDLHRGRTRSPIGSARDGGSELAHLCARPARGPGLRRLRRRHRASARPRRSSWRALGATVVGCGRRPEPLAEMVAEVEALGGRAEAEAMDIRDEEAVEALFDGVLERHGRIDVLVNNAGGQFLSPAEAITPKGFRTVIELNVTGTWLMTHAAATKAFIPQRRGKVLSVTLSPHNGMPGMVHSGAARAAVENMMRTLSIEWSRFGITLVALAAGQFGTETMRTKYPKEVVEAVPGTVPLGPARHRGGMGVAGRLPRLAGRRLLLGHGDHPRRGPRQLVRPLAAGRLRRVGRAAGRGAPPEGLTPARAANTPTPRAAERPARRAGGSPRSRGGRRRRSARPASGRGLGGSSSAS